MKTLVCLAVLLMFSRQDDLSEIKTNLQHMKRDDQTITASITKEKGGSTHKFELKKKGKFISITDSDGNTNVFGPEHFFVVEKTESEKFILNGGLSEPFDHESTFMTDFDDKNRQWQWLQYGMFRTYIDVPYNYVLQLFDKPNVVVTGPSSYEGASDRVQLEFVYDGEFSELRGQKTERVVLDSSNNYRLVSVEYSYEKINLTGQWLVEYKSPSEYELSWSSKYDGKIEAFEKISVSKTSGLLEDSEFTLAHYGIETTGQSSFRPAYWFIGIGVFLILIVLSVKLRARSRNA